MGGVGEWMSGQLEWDGVLSKCMCHGWIWGHGSLGGHGHGGRETGTCVIGVCEGADACTQIVDMRAAQEEEKCLAADAGRLTHGRMGLTSSMYVLLQQNRVQLPW